MLFPFPRMKYVLSRIGARLRLLVLAVVLSGPGAFAAAPDLVIWPDKLNPRPVFMDFTTNNCEVIEGCALPGRRRYLTFNTETRNIGDADMYLGNPVSNTNFIYALCHRHYHFMDFADYQLINSAGEPVAIGLKAGFCLLDSERWDTAGGPVAAKYDCSNQGIQRGWSDIYTRDLSCQWVDITGLPAGIYRLEIEVNPAGRLVERTRTNNVMTMSVYIDDPCTGPPANDDFANALVLSNRIETVFGSTGCATSEQDEPNHPDTGTTNSIWFRWTAPYSGAAEISTEGSTLDTSLAVFTGTNLADLTLVRGDDNEPNGRQTSRVTFTAASNQVYSIAVTGRDGMAGGVALNINPNGNDFFTNALALAGASGSISGRNTSARRETGEPAYAGITGTNSVWFCGRVPTSGLLRFDTEGSNFDTLLAVYTGSRITNLTLVATDNNSGTNKTSRLYFQAESGTNYWVAVDGVNGQSGFFRLNWGTPEGPRFASLRALGDGSREVNLLGSIGDRYRIESSGDFQTWSNWFRLTNLTGRIQFIDPVNNETRRRFYRAVLVP